MSENENEIPPQPRVLEGHRLLVTGAGRGLGRAYAEHAAGSGAVVVVNDVDGDEAAAAVAGIRASGGQAVASAHDVADAKQVHALFDLCRRELGGLDGLVNNAGLYHEALPWEEDPQQLRRLIEVNVLGTLYCTAHAARLLRTAGGSIVNASSGGAFGFPTIAAYAASKGAIASLTYSSALDLEAIGVRVNAIAPIAATRLTAAALGRTHVPAGLDRAPLAGLEDRAPSRIAPLVTYLLSDLAIGITGQMFRFDGSRLAIVRHYAFSEHPVSERESWAVEDVAATLAGPLRAGLEPYGIERRLPPVRR